LRESNNIGSRFYAPLIPAAAFAEVARNARSENMTRTLRLALSIATVAGAIPASAQDAAKGQLLFKQCRGCHAVGPAAKNKAGPQLNGVVGRRAATAPGFKYSDAMKEAAGNGLVWTDANLSAYLESPDTFLPRGVMAFAGVKDAGALKDLVAFLKTQK
jgi:cytochrome c